jgi:dihydrofolate reductase
MPFAHRLLITEGEQEPAGDVRFPDIDPAQWHETAREQRDGFAWVTYER